MPWARTDWMSERVKFVAAYLEFEGCGPGTPVTDQIERMSPTMTRNG
jgi:hypothetical protein